MKPINDHIEAIVKLAKANRGNIKLAHAGFVMTGNGANNALQDAVARYGANVEKALDAKDAVALRRWSLLYGLAKKATYANEADFNAHLAEVNAAVERLALA